MAMKTRPSTSLRPVYEDFEPSTELTETHDAHFLQIHLPPGFTKDQIRIAFLKYNRTLNVYGEIPIDGENYRWIRFNQSYPISQNCEEGKLRAKFSQGVLTITMPKKIVSPPSPRTEAQQKGPFPLKKLEPSGPHRKAQDDIPLEEPKPEKAQEKIPQKYAPGKVEEERPEKAHEGLTPSKKEERKHEKVREEAIPQRFRIPRGKEDLTQNREDERGFEALKPQEPIRESKPQKCQEETEPTPTKVQAQRRPGDEKPPMGPSETDQKPTLKIAPKKPKNEKPEKGPEEIEKERETEKEEERKLPLESRKPEKMFQEKEIRTRKKTPKAAEKENGSITGKEDIVVTIGEGIKQVSASTSQVVTKISEGKWNDEEKPMLVNMGAAMLVIAALGVYISYKIASSGST